MSVLEVAEYARLCGTGKTPIPSRLQILNFLNTMWEIFHLKLSKILSTNFDSPMIWELTLT